MTSRVWSSIIMSFLLCSISNSLSVSSYINFWGLIFPVRSIDGRLLMQLRSIDGRLKPIEFVVLLNNFLSLMIVSCCSISKRKSSSSYNLRLGLDFIDRSVFFLVWLFSLFMLIHPFLLVVIFRVLTVSFATFSLLRFWFWTRSYDLKVLFMGKMLMLLDMSLLYRRY